MNRIIAISGQISAGKSLFAQTLHQRLRNSMVFSVDWYEWAKKAEFPLNRTAHPYERIKIWAARGGEPSEYVRIPSLVKDLTDLKEGRSIQIERSQGEVRIFHPADFIIFESHFGRDFRETAPLIDLQIHLDVPMDISLARILLLCCKANPAYDTARTLQAFLDGERLVWERMRISRGQADLILDGCKPVGELADEAGKLLPIGPSA